MLQRQSMLMLLLVVFENVIYSGMLFPTISAIVLIKDKLQTSYNE